MNSIKYVKKEDLYLTWLYLSLKELRSTNYY